MKKLIRKAVLLTTILSLSFCISIWAANRTLVSQQVYTDENGEQMRSLKYSDGSTDEFDLTVDDYLVSEKDENGIRYSTYANGDTSNVYIDQINEYSSFTKQYGPIIKGCDFAKDENGQKIVDADGSRYISKIRFMEKAGGGEIALDKSEYLKVGKYDHFRLIALKYSIPIRFKDGIYTEWMADRDNGFKGKLVKTQTDEKYEKEKAKKQAEAKADQQQIDLNNQINAELNTKSENKAGQKTALPYSSDYIKNYRIKAVEESHNKVWASFDNERNYVQQWLTANGFKNLKELENIRYNWKTKEDEEKSAKYSSQSKAAQQYYKEIESGVLSQNCSMGDWIRYNLKKDLMGGWNGLAMWADKVDISIVSYGGQYNDKLMSYQDIYNINKEIYRMIESNLSTIYSYNYLTLEQKTSLVEQLNTQFISPFGSQGKKYVSGYESRAELINKIKHKWSTEYLTEADKEEMRKKGKDYWTEQQWKDYLD